MATHRFRDPSPLELTMDVGALSTETDRANAALQKFIAPGTHVTVDRTPGTPESHRLIPAEDPRGSLPRRRRVASISDLIER